MARLIHPIDESGAVAVTSDALSLPFPPLTYATIPTSWSNDAGMVGEFDLHIYANATVNLSAAELFGGVQRDHVLADDDVDTTDFANNELDLTAHVYQTGDGPLQLTTSDTLPTGLALATDYYAIYVGANTIQLATSVALAHAGTAVAFSDVGVGTHTISDVVGSTKRVYWQSAGLLGDAKDGVVEMTVTKGYMVRLSHSPLVFAYAVGGTMSASSPETVSAEITAVIDR